MFRFPILARLLPLFAALFVLFLAADARAQTTGDLDGTVTAEDDGTPLEDVSVTITSPALIGGSQLRKTDPNGYFHFTQLAPGTYAIQYVKGGFVNVTISGVLVSIGQTRKEDMKLKEGNEATITVTDKANTVDTSSTKIATVLTKDFLQDIPTGRSYQEATKAVAGVIDSGTGNNNMGGAAQNQNTYMLDGVNITDPVTGTFSLNFNYDAIQQIEVVLGGYEPEYGVSLGGIVNVVTATGTNNLQFDTSAYYQNGNWSPKIDARYGADGFQLSPTQFDTNFQIIQINAMVSGPVIRDRAWFIFSYAGERSLYNNVGVNVPQDYDGQYVLGKLTIQPSSEHRLTVMTQLDPTTIDNLVQGYTTVKPEAQGRQAQGGYVGQVRWQWFLSPNANLDTQVFTQKEYLEGNAVPCTHDRKLGYNPCLPNEQEGTVDWFDPGRAGAYGAFDSVNYSSFDFDNRYRYQASSKLQLLSVKDPLNGTHDFKFGVEGDQNIWDRVVGYNGNTLYVDLNKVSYDPATFESFYWLETTGPIRYHTSASEWDWFAQDAYKPIPNLTIKYGVRYDHTIQRNDAGTPVINTGLWGPRLFAAWDPFGDQKTKIAGGYGRFNDTGRLDIANFTSSDSLGQKLFLGEYFPGQDGQGFLNNQNNAYAVAPRTNPNLVANNVGTPRIDEFVLLLQRQVVEDVSVGTNLDTKLTRYLYEPDEVNVIYDQNGSQVIGARNGNTSQNIYRLRTPELAKRNYFQADFYLQKIKSHRWYGQLTYTFTKSLGTSLTDLSGSFINDPQTKYNYGPLYETDITHVVKAYGAWQLPTDPWTQTLGFTLYYYSGQPYEKLYYAEDPWTFAYGTQFNNQYYIRIRPRGIYGRLPGWWEMNLKFQQDIKLKKGKLVVNAEAQNLFNNNAAVNVYDTYIYTLNRMSVVSRQIPLNIKLGAEYTF